jgi:alkylhydroperoxidase family enzyme
MRALLEIAAEVQRGGRGVTRGHVDRAMAHGATQQDVHDTVLIAAAFCMYNRYVDGLGAWTPDDPGTYRAIGARLAADGYLAPAPAVPA